MNGREVDRWSVGWEVNPRIEGRVRLLENDNLIPREPTAMGLVLKPTVFEQKVSPAAKTVQIRPQDQRH